MSVRASQLRGWVPIRVYWEGSRPLIDWCWVGTRPYAEPFFNQTIDAALQLPFSSMFRPQTSLDTLAEHHAIEPGLHPRGFIFHMSRCGSTLVSQLLAALAGSVVLSESGPIDSVLRAKFRDPLLSDQRRAEWLRWMVSALAQRRSGDEKQLFIKFDSWSALDLPLIHRAYPDVPWIFLYRNPVEVLASQLARRGAHMVPGAIEPELFGMTVSEAYDMQPEQYCARVLACACEAALSHQRSFGGMMINYEQLPEAAWTEIPDFFRVEHASSDLETLRRVAQFDAKNPSVEFTSDLKAKRVTATAAVLQAVEHWLSPVYERLEAARFRTQPT
ncbi:MAG: sulfotransferase family protein [Blastocatellia bacterium]